MDDRWSIEAVDLILDFLIGGLNFDGVQVYSTSLVVDLIFYEIL